MMGAHCEWTESTAATLDLHTSAAQRHLIRDARVAEEIAIHHADVTRGHRSGHYAGAEEYGRTRDRCLATLTAQIASGHDIGAAQVAAAVGQRDQRLDGAVLLAFILLYAIAANLFARRLVARFPPDQPWPALIGTAAAAIFVGAAGVILGGLGATLVEMIQVGDTHLSYRAERLPWSQHWLPLFVGGVVLFSLIATIRWRRAAISAALPSTPSSA
jgi:hypothetical protein